MEVVEPLQVDRVGVDPMDALEARGAAAVGVLNAASAELVGVIADALVTEAWRGFNSPEHWVGLRFGLGPARARRYVAAARALTVLPRCRAAYGAGELSEDHIAVIVQAEVTACHDDQVVELARHATIGQLRHALKSLPPPPTDDDAHDDGGESGGESEAKGVSRSFVSRRWRDDGRYEIHGVLDPLTGALVDNAIDAAIDKLHRTTTDTDGDGAAQARERVSATDALAYALGLALDAMDPVTATNPDRMPSERYVVNIHLDATNPERMWLHLGPLLPPQLREQLLCDTLTRLWTHHRDGNVDLGRTRRTANPKLRAAVEHRDGGCAIPGCPNTRGLRIHHITAWDHGGPTDLANLCALCAPCHRAVHTGRYHITPNPHGGITVTDPTGKPLHYQPPPPPEPTRPSGTEWRNRRGDRADWACLWWRNHPDTS